MRALSDGVLSREVSFEVGAATVFGPRFWPRAGRSFRIDGTVQKDTLRRESFGGPVTFSLLNAPSFVTLTSDSIVNVGAVSDQPFRSLYFQAVAVDGAARRDTAWFHVVDMSKPHGPLVDVAPVAGVDGAALSLAGPSPFRESTALRWRAPATGRVSLTIHDLRGRRLRTLVRGAAGAGGTIVWDGLDEAGAAAPAGMYFALLDTGVEQRALKLAKLR